MELEFKIVYLINLLLAPFKNTNNGYSPLNFDLFYFWIVHLYSQYVQDVPNHIRQNSDMIVRMKMKWIFLITKFPQPTSLFQIFCLYFSGKEWQPFFYFISNFIIEKKFNEKKSNWKHCFLQKFFPLFITINIIIYDFLKWIEWSLISLPHKVRRKNTSG